MIFPLRSDWADFKSTPLGCKGYWAGKRKKESLLAGMGHKEVASENVDKSSKC